MIDIVRLARSENVGPKTFFTLIKLFGSPARALEMVSDLALKGGRAKPIKVCSTAQAEKEMDQANKIGAKIITYKSAIYPALLKQIPDPPPILTYLGNPELLSAQKKIAIVGSRNCSSNARIFASQITQDLCSAGFLTVSGLARGIDSAVHNIVPDKTIAVVAGGIDNIYPLENKDLYHKIASQGLLISEMPFACKPLSHFFPQRNRIISGLSLATIVIEATLKSGTLITAGQALEQNRELFAVPGFPLDPRSRGGNKLLKEGAHLLESANDIISTIMNPSLIDAAKETEIYNNEDNFNPPMAQSDIKNTDRKKVKDALSSSPISVDHLCAQIDLPMRELSIIIVEFELAGKINRHIGGKISYKYS